MLYVPCNIDYFFLQKMDLNWEGPICVPFGTLLEAILGPILNVCWTTIRPVPDLQGSKVIFFQVSHFPTAQFPACSVTRPGGMREAIKYGAPPVGAKPC